jgi:hypothetical protein
VVELFVGIGWAEDHHDLCVMDAAGKVAAKGRVSNDLAGVARAHHLIASGIPEGVDDDEMEVVVNPLAVDRYRDRARVSGAKSGPGDARVLADMARTDAHQHRPVAADSELADAIKLVAPRSPVAISSRRRLANQLRSALREFYPGALEASTACATPTPSPCWPSPPTPERGRALSRAKVASGLRRGGRRLNVERRAEAIQGALRGEQLAQPATIADAYGAIAESLTKVIEAHTHQISDLEAALT